MSIAQSNSAEQLGHDLLSLLPRLNRIVSRELRSEAGDDPTLVQLRVLDRLLEEPMTLSELARKRGITLQAASEHVQSLVERGWVIRIPDTTDRRRSSLQITEEGERRLNDMREHVEQHFTPVLQQLTPHETEALHEGVLALRRILTEEE